MVCEPIEHWQEAGPKQGQSNTAKAEGQEDG